MSLSSSHDMVPAKVILSPSATIASTTMKPTNTTRYNSLNSFEFDDKEGENADETESRHPNEKQDRKPRQEEEEDSNEAQENIQNSVVVDLESSELPITNGSEIGSSDPESMAEETLATSNDDQDQDQISRRVLKRHKLANMSPSSITEELRKLKNQRNKLFSKTPLKRKKGKKKSKSTQTRQGTTTVGYGSLDGGTSSYSSLTGNSLSNSLRQHFPALTNSQQISSTVQKLIMNKLTPQSISGRQNIRYQQLQQAMDNGSGVQQLSLSNSGFSSNNPRLADILNQWAASDDTPMYAPSSRLKQPQQGNNKMIPIEIIGLDPTVTNSILYGEGATRTNPQADSSQQTFSEDEPPQPISSMYPSGLSLTQSVPRGLRAAAKAVLERPKASSILHIHHFHTQVKPTDAHHHQMQQQQHHHHRPQQVASSSVVDNQGLLSTLSSGSSASDSGGIQQPSYSNLVQMMQQQNQRPQAGGAKGEGSQQQVYVNDRGQLVYLSVDEQSNSDNRYTSGTGAPPVEQEQQVEGQQPLGSASDNQEAWPSGDTTNPQQQMNGEQQETYVNNGAEMATNGGDQQQSSEQSANQDQQQQQSNEAVGIQQEPVAVQVLPQNLTNSQTSDDGSTQSNYGTLNQVPNGQQTIFMVPTVRGQSQMQTIEPKPQHVYMTNSGQTISLIGQNNPQSNDAEQSKQQQQTMLMVAYKPKPQVYRNLTEDSLISTRNPYNEGQESKPPLVSSSNQFMSSAPKLFKTTNLLLRPIIDSGTSGIQNTQFQPSLGLTELTNSSNVIDFPKFRHKINITELANQINVAELASHLSHSDHDHAIRSANASSPVLQVPARYQIQENRVPSPTLAHSLLNPILKSLLLDTFNGTSYNNKSEVANLQASSWLTPLADDRIPHLNGYSNSINNRFLANLIQNNSLNSFYPFQYQQNSLLDNSALFKNLQLLRDKLLLQQQLSSLPSRFNTQQLFNNTIKSPEELISLINDIKLTNSSLMSSNSNPISVPNTDIGITVPSIMRATNASIKTKQPSKLTVTPKHNISTTNGITSSQSGNSHVQPNLKITPNQSSKDFNSVSQWQGNQQVKKQPPMISETPSTDGYEDTNGLSNIALAFIFVVSLITLIIIAVSMIYRHKRRSVGRCANLPARSARRLTRNLTKRTKHFVRSNFVSPNDVTSIKSINLDATSSPSVTTKSPISSVGCLGGDEFNNSMSDSCRVNAGYITKKTFGQTLSTFNSTSLSDKYHFSKPDDSAAIKTLNTRLQRPSYLKSLISSPDCLGKKSANNRTDSSESSYYLNVRNRSGNIPGKQFKSRSPTEESCKLSETSKKNICDSIRNYNNSNLTKESNCFGSTTNCDKLPIDIKTNLSKKSMMSTIHSISECETKPTIIGLNGGASQLKKQTNSVFSRLGKPNSQVVSKNLAASLPSNQSSSSEDRDRSNECSQSNKL